MFDRGSAEAKLAKAMFDSLNQMDFDVNAFAYGMGLAPAAMQQRVFELLVAMIGQWNMMQFLPGENQNLVLTTNAAKLYEVIKENGM